VKPTRPPRRSAAAALLLCAAALLLCAGCLHARGTAEEPAVVSVDLEGVKAADQDDLRAKLATQASDRWAFGETRKLDLDALAFDQRRVLAFYRERGFYRASVDEPEVLPDGEGRVRVVIRVHEGNPVRVTRLDVEGLDAAPEARPLASRLALAPGHIFTWAEYDATRDQLQKALGASGYATGTVKPSAVVHGDEGTAEVTYRVEPGRRYKFGPVSVQGNVDVPKDKITTRARRAVKQGDWFDERKLEQIQERVTEMGVFAGVRATRGTPEPQRDELPVNITVREAPFRTVRVGPGLGFQPSRWDVFAQATWIDRNWLGDLRTLKLDLRGGWAWIPTPFSAYRQGAVGNVSASFLQPTAVSDRVDFSVTLQLEKDLEQAYGAVSQKFSIGTPIRPAPRWTLVPSYNFQVYELTDVVGNPANLPVQNCPKELCVLSFLEQRVTWDGRDNPLVTTRGTFLSLSLQEGFPAGGNGYVYFRFLPEVRFFVPLGRNAVLATRARVGAIIPINEVGPAPLVGLFTSGGPNSMRGYSQDRLSPMVNQDGTWVPTGGNGLIDASVELRRNIAGSLWGAVFLDAGNVSTASGTPTQYKEIFDLSLLQFALGVGLRYRTPVGPFRADFAVRLPNDLSPGVPFPERFPAVPGNSGHREPIAVLHVSLGEAY
jgi:translocation and assembly module TamA